MSDVSNEPSSSPQPGAAPSAEVDARGLTCPMPLLQAKRALNALDSGQRLRVIATDPGSMRDFEVFSKQSGHQLLSADEADGTYTYVLLKK